jgi:hypothetical protein
VTSLIEIPDGPPWDPRMSIGRYFRLWEATRSDEAARRGIENQPDESQLYQLVWLCKHLMDPVREMFGRIRVSSGLRTRELNPHIRGSSNTSAHTFGCAFDFHPLSMSIRLSEIVEWVAQSDLPFDQVIYEYNWIHLGAAKPGRSEPRREIKMKFHRSGYETFDPQDPRVVR